MNEPEKNTIPNEEALRDVSGGSELLDGLRTDPSVKKTLLSEEDPNGKPDFHHKPLHTPPIFL